MQKCNQAVQEKSLNLNSLILLLWKGHNGHSGVLLFNEKTRQQTVKAVEVTVQADTQRAYGRGCGCHFRGGGGEGGGWGDGNRGSQQAQWQRRWHVDE